MPKERCEETSFGGAMYACPHCGNIKFVPFRCKSRFCPTCGIKYSQERSTQIAFKLIRCTHRHCVFTIDEDLRRFFLEDRSLLGCLFQAARSVVFHMFHNLNKSKNFKMTRYYGLYSRHREKNKSLWKAVPKSRHRLMKTFTKWYEDILLSFDYDPLRCTQCNHEMQFVELYYNHRRVSLEELYERAKVKCRSA